MAPSSERSSVRPAVVYSILLLGLISFSMSAILVRFADEAPGMAIAVWRTVFAALMLAPFALATIAPEVRQFVRRDLWMILGAGVLLGLHFVTWIESLYHTSVASASVLVTVSPIFLAVFGYLFLRERLSAPVVAAIVMAVCGAALIGWGDASGSGGGGSNNILGNSLALVAAMLVSFYMLIGRVVRRKTSWLAYLFPLYAVVAITTLVLALVFETPLFGYDATFYGLCALMAIGPQIIGHGSLNYALRYLPAAILGVITLVEPVGASILAYLFFDEAPSWIAVGGMLLVLLSISFAILFRRRRTTQPEAQIGGAG